MLKDLASLILTTATPCNLLVQEYVERTLTQDLRKYNRGFPPLLAKMVLYQLLKATAFLHKSRIIHRDLKPANILLTGDNVVKLCDFGFARTMHPKEVADYTTYVVTRWYR
jgi:cyclin-dependent kinase-like